MLSQAKEESWGTEEILKRIDRAIEGKTMLRTRYEAKLQNLKSKANKETGKERIQTYQQIFRAYAHFQSDSALAYLNRIEESADLLDKPSSLRQWITIGRAEVYGIMGLYKSAATLLEQVHIQAEDKFCDFTTIKLRVPFMVGWLIMVKWVKIVRCYSSLLPTIAIAFC